MTGFDSVDNTCCTTKNRNQRSFCEAKKGSLTLIFGTQDISAVATKSTLAKLSLMRSLAADLSHIYECDRQETELLQHIPRLQTTRQKIKALKKNNANSVIDSKT